MKLVITYYTDRFSILRSIWKMRDSQPQTNARSDCVTQADLGGRIVVLDLEEMEIENERRVRTPFGVTTDGSRIFVATGADQWTARADGSLIRVYNMSLEQIGSIDNKLFNDIHNITYHVGKDQRPEIVVTSTGIDTVLAVGLDGVTTFTWGAIDHGYNTTSLGAQRFLRDNADHRYCNYPTPSHTTHVNTAFQQGNRVYATLCKQGRIIRIHRDTGRADVIIEGLNYPHSFLPVNDRQFIVCDTTYVGSGYSKERYGRVLIYDTSFNPVITIEDDFCWVQHAFPAELHGAPVFIIADSNNSRLVFYGLDGRKIGECRYNPEWRISSFVPL